MPAGLLTTNTSSSSKRMVSATSSGRRSIGSGAGSEMVTLSPAWTICLARLDVPFSRTWPDCINVCIRALEKRSIFAVRKRSRRCLASAGATTIWSISLFTSHLWRRPGSFAAALLDREPSSATRRSRPHGRRQRRPAERPRWFGSRFR